jgi:lipopolysaccharide export system permease protein
MRLRWFGILDRYVLKQWIATFVLSAVGVPAVAVLIDLSERFSKLSVQRHLPIGRILLGQMYLFPSKMSMLVPAAVLFATVFTLNGLGRHSELTAVQGGGISFYRLIAPMLFLATLAVPLDFELQELAGWSTTQHNQIHLDETSSGTPYRADFAYASPSNWTWSFKEMHQRPTATFGLGVLAEGPRTDSTRHWMLAADSAVWEPAAHAWSLRRGTAFLVTDSSALASFGFTSLRLRALTETPGELMTATKKADEMTTAELSGYLERLKKSGAKAGVLAVELPLKYAIPFACLVVALFGAPLAITNARAGAAIGLAIALGTTLAYLTGNQIMKAIGAKEMLDPILAAWSMNLVFLVLAVVLLARVKS